MAKKTLTTKLTDKQLDHYKQLLLEKMRELLGDVSSLEEGAFQGSGGLSNMPVHLADIGTDSYEQEFSISLVAEERKTLVEIQKALGRIEDGTYGICEGLETPIEKPRLEAIPWTRFSLEYAKLLESGKSFDLEKLRARPNDIQRDDFNEDDVEEDQADEEGKAQSLDAIEADEDYGEEDDDLARQRDSA
ncbi:MAG: TraR/DksA family transcriptional regulator [Planctomycetota bacterium]|jgi:RNA polymerase-binding transcription factor DksA